VVMREISWVALIGGVLTLVVVLVSVFVPWWRLSAGENLIEVGVSPFDLDVSLLGRPLTIAVVGAFNLSAVLLFVVSGVVMLIYSVVPTRSYARHFVGFAYSKPLAVLLSFVVLVFGLSMVLQVVAKLSVPVWGSATVVLPAGFVPGVDLRVSLVVTATFQWSFWLAVFASGVCVVARLYHRRFGRVSLSS